MEIKIIKIKSFEELDKEKFKTLIESSFGKKLVDDYFEYVSPDYILLAMNNHDYAGVCVVEKIPGLEGIFYLDKIATAKEFQGNGVFKSLLEKAFESSGKLFWRAKKTNNITAKYDGLADEKWNPDFSDFKFYYKGKQLPCYFDALEYASHKKPTLEDIEK